MNMKRNPKYIKILFAGFFFVAYIILLRPYIYSVYYSLPANDDFALAINWWGHGVIGEAINRVRWNYIHWSGQSGVIATFLQVLFNPLHWFNNEGHSFGICMLIANGLVILGIVDAIKGVLNYYFELNNELFSNMVVFIAMSMITTSYYYNDVYNWWSGFVGYAFMLMLAFQCIKYECKFLNTREKLDFALMLICGMLACTSIMCCVPIGASFIVILIGKRKNAESIRPILIALCLYIIAGVSTVVAPGNHNRAIARAGGELSLKDTMLVSYELLNQRFVGTMNERPWVPILLMMVMALGVVAQGKRVKLWKIVLSIIGLSIATMGGIIPYIYGQSKTLEQEFAPRALYIFDYCLFVSMSVIFFAIGIYLSQINYKKYKIGVMLVGIASIFVIVKKSPAIHKENIVQYDMSQKEDIIYNTFVQWSDILDEFENALPGSDIVVTRPSITWCTYVYYPGIDDEISEPIKSGEGYANCNQAAAKYYGLNSVAVVFE